MKNLFILIIILVANFALAEEISGILSSCEAEGIVEIVISGDKSGDLAETDITILIRANKESKKDVCPKTNTDSNKEPYPVDKQLKISVPQKILLAAYCPPKSRTTKALTSTICIYASNNMLFTQRNYKVDTSISSLSIKGVTSGNNRISFTIEDAKDLAEYEVCYSQNSNAINALSNEGECTGADIHSITSSQKQITLTGLKNGHIDSNPAENTGDYYFKVRGKGGGASNPWSGVQSAIPILTFGAMAVYDGEENPLSWGCDQTSGAPGTWGLILMLAGLLLLIRKREKRHCERSVAISPFYKAIRLPRRLRLLAMTIFLMPAIANAHPGQVNFGLLGTPYRPKLDSSTKSDGSKAQPFYNCMFEDRLMPLLGVEADWHLLDNFGSLQLGFGAGYTYAGGKALTTKEGCSQSGDKVGMHIMQFRPQLTYILDKWVETVPFAPYLRAAIVTQGYIFTYQDGFDNANNQKPMGFIFGYELAAGLMFMLDWLEPSVSKSARANKVYEHVYLKAEAAYAPINNFHTNGLDFSSAWPSKDFPLLLTFGLVFEFE